VTRKDHMPWSEIRRATTDPSIPIGTRVRRLRQLHEFAVSEERSAMLQLGAEAAKMMIEKGFRPTGRTIGEVLTEAEEV
jgi:hypothetical protein